MNLKPINFSMTQWWKVFSTDTALQIEGIDHKPIAREFVGAQLMQHTR